MPFFIKPRPIIAVTGPDKFLKFGWWATRLMLLLCGARACYLSPSRPMLKEPIKGVVIGGGDDIEPEHYGETGDAGAVYDPARDQLEMAVFRAAIAADIPVLGICRGSQLINIVLGGSLITDLRPLRDQTPNYNSAFPIKWVDISQNSRLNRIVQSISIKVNSLHNQAVDRVGKGLSVCAHDKDSFIQAIESTKHRFVIGVQWHPEYLPYKLTQWRLFRALVKHAGTQSRVVHDREIER